MKVKNRIDHISIGSSSRYLYLSACEMSIEFFNQCETNITKRVYKPINKLSIVLENSIAFHLRKRNDENLFESFL